MAATIYMVRMMPFIELGILTPIVTALSLNPPPPPPPPSPDGPFCRDCNWCSTCLFEYDLTGRTVILA
jgi:hypothetical protein